MKKVAAALSLGLVSFFCHGEDSLFPTNILKKGDISIAATVGRDTHSAAMNYQGNRGKESYESNSESANIRYGLGSDWQIGASISQYSRYENQVDFYDYPAHYKNRAGEGEQNPVLRASYGIINDGTKRFSLTAGVTASIKTTSLPSTYSASLHAGWSANETLKYYGGFSATINDDSRVSESRAIDFGLYKRVSKNLTLVPYAAYVWFDASDTVSSRSQQVLGLDAQLAIFPKTYLIPSISAYRNSSRDSTDGRFHAESTSNGRNYRLGVYHLF